MLAVKLDQRVSEAAQRLAAHRLVVDKGARASVGQLDTAQDELIFGRDPAFGEHFTAGSGKRRLKHRCDLSLLGAVAHECCIATRTERKRACCNR